MKRILFALLLFSGTATFAQRYSNPPASVRDQFRRDNPDYADRAKWRRDNNNQWYGTYRDANNHNVTVYYDRKGNRRYTQMAWNRNEVPSTINDRVYRKYRTRNYRVTRIERPNNDPLFQISLNFGGRNRVMYMDEQGRERPYNR